MLILATGLDSTNTTQISCWIHTQHRAGIRKLIVKSKLNTLVNLGDGLNESPTVSSRPIDLVFQWEYVQLRHFLLKKSIKIMRP